MATLRSGIPPLAWPAARTLPYKEDDFWRATKNGRPNGPPYKRKIDGKPVHGAIDIKGRIGDAIMAARKGTVVWTGREHEKGKMGSAYGNRVLLEHRDHDGGLYGYSLYAHLHTVVVKGGQAVRAGEAIGTLGNTGSSFGPHLHFEWHFDKTWDGALGNPAVRLRTARQRAIDAAKAPPAKPVPSKPARKPAKVPAGT